MTDIDVAELRRLAAITDRAYTPDEFVAIVTAYPALLDAVEAVARAEALAEQRWEHSQHFAKRLKVIAADGLEAVKQVQIKRGFPGSPAAVLAGSHAKQIRAALVSPSTRAPSVQQEREKRIIDGVRKWMQVNEIAQPPLDWAGLGEFLHRCYPEGGDPAWEGDTIRTGRTP